MRIKIFIVLIILFISYSTVTAKYTKNVNNDFVIYKIEDKISKIVKKSQNPIYIKNKLSKKIENILWKNKNEINKISSNLKYNYSSFKEYWLIKIYNYLKLNSNTYKYPKILENDYIKIIIINYEGNNNSNIKLNNKYLFRENKKWEIIKYLEFYKIDSKEKIEKFIDNNFLEKKYIWKCKTKLRNKNYISFTKNNTYSISKYWDYKLNNCWKYSEINKINYFEKISKNILMYTNITPEYIWIDFNTIQYK